MKGIRLESYVKKLDTLTLNDRGTSPSNLKVTTLPDPKPAHDEYLVEIRAAATNLLDLHQVRGKYQHQPPFPWVAGIEFAGTIMAAPTTGKFRKGDRVFGAKQGAYATRVTIKEEALLRVPDGWSFEDASAIYVTAPTSYAALLIRAKLAPGETVLVHAGAGGVGLAAIQIAKAAGAIVIATASTPAKLAVCAGYGADHVLDYSSGDWGKRVLGLTNNKGVDVVFDPVGLIEQSLKCIAWSGRLLVIGFAGGKIEKVALNRVLLKNVSIVGIHWGMYAEKEKKEGTVDKVWAGIMKLISEGRFRPTVFRGVGGEVFVGLESVGSALEALEKRETWGKVVVSVPRDLGSKL